MDFHGYYSPRAARCLLDVPLDSLMAEMSRAVEESGRPDIESGELKELLLCRIPHLRLQISPGTEYPILDEGGVHEIIQELLHQHYLTLSEQDHNKQGPYFRVVGRDEVVCACQREYA